MGCFRLLALLAVLARPDLLQAAGSFVCAGGFHEGVRTGPVAGKPAQSPTRGTRRVLAIFAGFADDRQGAPPAWAGGLFDPHLAGSLSHFYDTMSFGALEVRGEVAASAYRSERGAQHYLATKDTSAGSFGTFTLEILEKADTDIDFALYDSDGPDGVPNSGDDDGVVDAIFLVLEHVPARFLLGRATGMGSLGLSEYWVTDDPGIDGEAIRISPRQGTLQQGRSFSEAVGAMCHEYGHILGLPDLYNTEYLRTPGAPPSEDSAGIGAWGLMGWGAMGWKGDDGPASFCAWSRMELGWSEVVEVSEDRELMRVADVGQGGEIYRIPLARRGLSGEFLLLEHRRRTANYYDRHIPGEGLLIWHVTERPPADGVLLPPLVDLECADGRWLDAGYPLGEQADPTGGDNLDFWAHDEEYTRLHGGNLGDATDPFDGVQYRAFTPETNPSSLTGDGSFSLRLEPIQLDGEEMVVSLQLGVPQLEIVSIALDDPEGERVLAGEEISVQFELANRGGAKATGLTVQLRTDDPLVEVLSTGVPLPDLRIGDTGPNLERAELPRLRISREIAADHDAAVSLEIRGDREVSLARRFTVRSRPSFMLSGSVTGDTGEPVPGATVSVWGSYPTRYNATVPADGFGGYQIFVPSGRYGFDASGPETSPWGYAYQNVWVAEDMVHDFVLPRWYLLSGTVRGPDGKPVPRMSLYVGNERRGTYAVTDGDGRYEVRLPQDEGYRIRTTQTEAGHPLQESGDIAVDGDIEVDIDLLPGVSMTVHVVDMAGVGVEDVLVSVGMAPSAGVYVYLSSSSPLGWQELKTQADGRAAFRVLPGVSVIRIVQPQFHIEPEPVEVEVVRDTTVQVILQTGPHIAGVVRDETGRGVRYGHIVFLSLTDGSRTEASVARNGRYGLGLAPGRYRVWVKTIGMQEQGDFTINADRDLDFSVYSPTTLAGTVLDADGMAPVDAYLKFESLDGAGTAYTHVEADGSYMAMLVPSSYRVSVLGLLPVQQVVGRVVADDGPEMRMDFRLQRGSPLAGQVIAASIADLPHMSVTATSMDGSVSGRAHPDENGLFLIGLPDGRYRLELSGPVAAGSVTWTAGQVEHPRDGPVELRTPGGAHLSGRVTDAVGQAVHAQMCLLPGHTSSQLVDLGGAHASTWTDRDDGSFELVGRAGTYDLVAIPVSGAGRIVRGVQLGEDGPMDITLPAMSAGHRVLGRVLDEQDRPALRCCLWFHAPRGDLIVRSMASEQGMYSIDLPGGTYNVTASEWGGAGRGPYTPVGTIEVTANQERDFRISPATAVEEAVSPSRFSLSQSYPNPFNSSTMVQVEIPTNGHVELTVYNLLGQRVATLVDEAREAGEYAVRWDGRDDAGRRLATGVYLYRLQAGPHVETRKLLLLR